MSQVDLLERALAAMEARSGWFRQRWARLSCHEEADALVFHDPPDQAVSLSVCVECLRAYVQVAEGVVYRGSLPGEEKTCQRCGTRHPVDDFVSQNGFPTKYCSACRKQWSKDKFAAEQAVREAQELADALAAKETLAAMRRDLRRIEAELADEGSDHPGSLPQGPGITDSTLGP